MISVFDHNISLHYLNKRVSLPHAYQAAVEEHWNNLLAEGKPFFRGEAYTIDRIERIGEKIDIFVMLTDYAHFLYTIHHNGPSSPYDCRVIYTSALIETADHKLVVGEMGKDTAFPAKLQLIGGGIDKGDVKGNTVDLEHNIRKEIAEELGIDPEDGTIARSLTPCYLYSGGKHNFLSAIFKLDLWMDGDQLSALFSHYNAGLLAKGIKPEINSLVFMNADPRHVAEFIDKEKRETDINLFPALCAAAGLIPCKPHNL